MAATGSIGWTLVADAAVRLTMVGAASAEKNRLRSQRRSCRKRPADADRAEA